MKTKYLITALVLSIFPIAAGQAIASEHPWPMFQHDSQHTGQSPYTGPETSNIKWIFDSGGISYAPAIGSDGTIYLTSSNGLRAINPNGTQKWLHGIPWTVGTPAIAEDGTIYVVFSQGIAAINPNNTLKWQNSLPVIYSSTTNPIIGQDGKIYLIAGYAFPDNTNHLCLITVSPQGTMNCLYEIEEQAPGFILQLTPPTIDLAGAIYFGYNYQFFAIDNNGTLKWKLNFPNYPITPATISSDNTIYVLAGGKFQAISSEGQILWSSPSDPPNLWSWLNTPAAFSPAQEYVYVSGCFPWWGVHECALFSFDRQGNQQWARYLSAWPYSYFSAPIVDSQGTIYVVGDDNLMSFTSPGILNWSTKTGHNARSLSLGLNQTIYSPGYPQPGIPGLYAIGPAVPPNQPPTLSSLKQYKSDVQTEIAEGGITTESSVNNPNKGIVIFEATVSDPDNDQVKLQVELKEYNQPFDETNLLESNLISSGNEVTVTADNLTSGQYKWRARAVDDKEASSAWQEFGTAGNVDFEVKLVPLYTQVFSEYPSENETRSWFQSQYGNGGIGGYAEYRITLNNTDDYILTVNGKDDEAIDSKTNKKITAKISACLYKTKDIYGDPICIAEKILSWPLGDDQYKSVSAALARITAGSYSLRLTSKEDYFDLNNSSESGNLNVYLNWFEFRNATSSLLRQEAENDVSIKGGTKITDSGKAVVRIDGYSCGISIANCGCAMVSMVMLGRYYGIDIGIDGTEVTPLYMNEWLKKNNGYNKLGNLVWGKDKDIGAITYLGFKDSENITNVRLSLDVYNAATTSPAIGQYINSAKPAIVRNDKYGHYFIMDGKLASTYTIKDSSWYNTKTLNDNRIGEHIKNYEGKINAANLFSYLSTPGKIFSHSKSTSIYVASPVELIITDPRGRRLGKDPTTGMEYNEIPDAIYTYEILPVSEELSESEEASKIKVADIPDTMDGQYDIKVLGTRVGIYTLEFFTNDTSGRVKDETISGSIDADIIQDYEFNYSSQNVEETQVQQIVPIDIKPASFPNSVNCKNNKEIISVAILTTPLFDATAVDTDTVRFGPVEAQETHRDKKTGEAQRHIEDVDNDGDLDLVFHFRFGDTGIQCGDEKVTLTGLTIDGHNIMGTDTIRTVKVPYLLAGIIELPLQFFKSLAAKFAQWFDFLYGYFFSLKPIPDVQPEKITREPCLKENEGVWLIPQYWSYTYAYTHPYEEIVELTIYMHSKELLEEAISNKITLLKKGFSEDDMSEWVIKNNNFNFNISDVESSGVQPEIRKCGIYVSKLFKTPHTRYEVWKYDYSGRGERIMVLDEYDERGASIKASSNASYSQFKIDETETYVALVRSWYGEPEKHALVIKNLKTLEDVYAITIKELMEKHEINLGTIQLSDARERSVLFEVLNDENPWFNLNIDTRELERMDILP